VTATASALDEIVERASALEAGGFSIPIRRADAVGGDFVRADVLHAPGPLLGRRIAESAAGGDTDLAHVGAQWWLERCAWLITSAAFACALSSGRLPSLRPADVLIASASGVPAGVAFRDVPLAWDRDGEPGLAAVLREQVEAHLAPLVSSIAGLRLRPVRALWRAAGDRVVQSALWAGAATGRPERAAALARAVLVPGSPLAVPVRIAPGSSGEPVQQRASCCLAHRTPAKIVCENCPRAHRLDGRR
jgi:Ferric iron reductase FhuF-like transporter/FhuF 2Fe-2S C-terminal domain